jgi:hypothetical protein
MTQRQGSSEAPIGASIDWKNPEYYDRRRRTRSSSGSSICHGRRRCVSLCNAFPTLFDLIDESKTCEIDASTKPTSAGRRSCIVRLCQHDRVRVPPHPWNVDFPHLMRAKAQKFRRGETNFRDRLPTGTDRLGKLATIPVVVQAVNKANRMPLARKAMDRMLGIHRDRRLPPFAARRFNRLAPASKDWPVRNGERTPGRVAIFSTCYVNYNEPGIGLDLIAILEHNEIPYAIVEKEVCCGMPKLELGDFDGREAQGGQYAEAAAYARDGYAILTALPSCTLMFKS